MGTHFQFIFISTRFPRFVFLPTSDKDVGGWIGGGQHQVSSRRRRRRRRRRRGRVSSRRKTWVKVLWHAMQASPLPPSSPTSLSEHPPLRADMRESYMKKYQNY